MRGVMWPIKLSFLSFKLIAKCHTLEVLTSEVAEFIFFGYIFYDDIIILMIYIIISQTACINFH